METVSSVRNSETYKMTQELKNAGFYALIISLFDYNYNKDFNALVAVVSGFEYKIDELLKITNKYPSFESVLSQMADHKDPILNIRKNQAVAELVTSKVWNEYTESLGTDKPEFNSIKNHLTLLVEASHQDAERPHEDADALICRSLIAAINENWTEAEANHVIKIYSKIHKYYA